MRIAYVHFYVEDAKIWCDWFVNYLGFYRLEDDALTCNFPPKGDTTYHTSTEVVKSGLVCFVLSSPKSSISPVAKYLQKPPPGVVDVAFEVENFSATIALANAYGAKVIQSTAQYQNAKIIA